MEIRINPPAYLLQITALPHTTRECTKLHLRLTHTYSSCHSIDHYWLLASGPRVSACSVLPSPHDIPREDGSLRHEQGLGEHLLCNSNATLTNLSGLGPPFELRLTARRGPALTNPEQPPDKSKIRKNDEFAARHRAHDKPLGEGGIYAQLSPSSCLRRHTLDELAACSRLARHKGL
jgi:hypothetical protein